jgi:hypothetical protein
MGKEEDMKYVLLIYQPSYARAWSLSEDERKEVYAQYTAVNQTPGVTPGVPLGLPENAITVRVQNGKPLVTNGPLLDSKGTVGGYYVVEADDLDAAIEQASRIPAARLGGAIEIRPSATYW